MDWNLVPAKRRHCSQKQLYPVRQIRSVVHVPTEVDHSNPRLQDILRDLPLVFLDTESLPSRSIVASLVASISHPRALLHALASSLDTSTQITPADADVILSYFNDNLSALTALCSDEAEKSQLQCDLKKLPLFRAVDGSTLLSLPAATATFCLEVTVPDGGLLQWSRARLEPVVLLHKQKNPEKLREYLEISVLSTEQFYYELLLPTLDALPRGAILQHMQVVRAHLKQLDSSASRPYRMAELHDAQALQEREVIEKKIAKISSLLKATAFIEVDGFPLLKKASAFYSPEVAVFRAMCPERFPPQPYSEYVWSSFLKHAGIVLEVTEDEFIEYALSLQAVGTEKSLDKELLEKSEVLTDHLFNKTKKTVLLEGKLLSRLRNIRFVRPSEWRSEEELKPLLQIANPGEPYRLVSFAESCWECDLHLVWSCSPILHQKAFSLPDHAWKQKQTISVKAQLGLAETAPAVKVFQHVRNICDALSGENGKDIFTALEGNLVQRVMEKVYFFLGDNRQDVRQLQDLPIIFDPSKSQMLRPQAVVIDLREDEAIPEYIHRAPRELGQHFELFKRLGVSERVTANHYAKVLSDLSSVQAPLHVEELKVVIKAVEQLFVCLKSEEEERNQLTTVACLHLPSRDRLLKSTDLVFADDEDLRKRLAGGPADMDFFSFDELGLRVPVPEEEVKRLPAQHQMRWLSGIVREFVPAEIKSLQTQDGYSRFLAEKLEDPCFIGGVVRLAYNQHKAAGGQNEDGSFTGESERLVENALGRIVIRDVPELTTALERNGMTIEGSEQRTPAFVERSQGAPPACTVYVDTNCAHRTDGGEQAEEEEEEEEERQQSVFHSLAAAVQTVVGLQSVYVIYLKLLCEDVGKALNDMDKCKLSRYDTGTRFLRSIIPSPGQDIPVCQHCYLDNSFCHFYPGEHVGFEVHDPQIGGEETEDNDAFFVYATIQRQIPADSAGGATLLGTEYLINLGRGATAKVSMTRLYKFVRGARHRTAASSRALVVVVEEEEEETLLHSEASPALPAAAPPAAADATDEEPPPTTAASLRQALAEIRNTLREAWRLMPDEKGRKRVVKRLYLQWHPDKNQSRQEFCTSVVQALQRYATLLGEGGTLPPEDDEGEDDEGEDDSSFPQRGHAFASSFFSRMHERGRAYRAYYEAGGGGGGAQGRYGSRPSADSSGTDPGEPRGPRADRRRRAEGRRWLRQAQADVSAARAARGTCDKGRNWVCYMCHQVRVNELNCFQSQSVFWVENVFCRLRFICLLCEAPWYDLRVDWAVKNQLSIYLLCWGGFCCCCCCCWVFLGGEGLCTL